MAEYFFLFGNTPQLSLAELKSVLSDSKIKLVRSNIAAVKLKSNSQALQLINILGGTIKIFRLIKTISPEEAPKTEPEVVQQLLLEKKRVTFGLVEFGQPPQDEKSQVTAQSIKKELKNEGRSARYLEGTNYGLSASVLLNQPKIIEIGLVYSADETHLITTVAVQDIDDWSKRDRDKPYADRKKGMIPPKVARMMINLYKKKKDHGNQDLTIYDPFCGTGTILMEALLSKYQVVGSDLSLQAVRGAQENLDWLAFEYDIRADYSVFTRDATSKYSVKIKPWVDLLVTEPFLGKPTPQAKQLPNIFKGLEKLYLGAFKNWIKILKPGASIIIVFPLVETQKSARPTVGKIFSLEKLLDKLTALGYTTESGPYLYSRRKAIVKRQIWVFKYRENAN